MSAMADAIVVGAGPAGAAFAAYLGAHGRRVLVLDRAVFPRDKPCGEGILPAGVEVLRDLGVYSAALAAGAQPLGGVRYTLASGASARASFPAACGSGLAVRRLRLDALLVERARSEATVCLIEGQRVVALQRCGDLWQARSDHAQVFTAPLLVGADGYRSVVRRLLGWQGRSTGSRYGVVGHFRLPRARAAFQGDINVMLRPGLESYAAPVGEGEMLVALLGGRALMRGLAGDLRGGYLRSVRADPVLARWLRNAEPEAQVSACGPFPALASRVHGQGALLIGDAAGFVDPITGEGLARSLCGARLAATVAERALRSGRLDAVTLAPYARRLAAQTRDGERLTRLALLLCSSQQLSRLAMRGMQRDPRLLPRLLGIGAGAWGFEALSRRDWLAFLAGI